MALEQAFQFQIDEQYENEKGTFTVLSIKNGLMEIQWEDGEKIQTDIDLQRSIQIRRQMEEHFAEAEIAQKERKAAKAAGVRDRRFDGMLTTDFKDSAARTRWRGRDQLGGAVSQKLPRDVHTIQSWAVAQRPEVNWQDIAHRKRGGADHHAAFFVRADAQSLSYGMKVSRPAETEGSARDWRALAAWLSRQENADQVTTIAAENDLAFELRGAATIERLDPAENGWQASGASKPAPATYPASLMDTPSASAPTEVEIVGSMPKEDVLTRGGDIASDIAAVFQRLMPLYQAAVA